MVIVFNVKLIDTLKAINPSVTLLLHRLKGELKKKAPRISISPLIVIPDKEVVATRLGDIIFLEEALI